MSDPLMLDVEPVQEFVVVELARGRWRHRLPGLGRAPLIRRLEVREAIHVRVVPDVPRDLDVPGHAADRRRRHHEKEPELALVAAADAEGRKANQELRRPRVGPGHQGPRTNPSGRLGRDA